ncbi:MAG: hypothetical protein AB1486_16390 [Planctomycetota bacterium]
MTASEKDWLTEEVRRAASLTDRDRIRIFRDLLRTADAIRRTKSAEELEREEEARRVLEREPGLARYIELAKRLE